jgi:hypothetical protein
LFFGSGANVALSASWAVARASSKLQHQALGMKPFSSGDGYVEFTASETSTYRMCGLSQGDSDQNYTEIDFAMYPTGTGSGSHLYVYESGVYHGDFGAYATGDLLRVAVEGGVVKYKKNGRVIYTSTVAPSYPLLVDSSLYTNGSTLTNVVVSGNLSNTQSVSWMNAVGVSAAGNNLTKTAAAGSGNAGAASYVR